MTGLFIEPETAAEITRLADLTDRDEPLVIRNAIRTYAWIIRHQARGDTIIALAPKDVAYMERTPDLDGPRECLVRYVAVAGVPPEAVAVTVAPPAAQGAS